ncbi:hypothetical protein [Microbulbifer sp. TRSA005]|uniref:hypothetical protein n=1 Tax=Microbulbifer sp. TRSA005 TaxID=3243383 RepID=UPI004039E784
MNDYYLKQFDDELIEINLCKDWVENEDGRLDYAEIEKGQLTVVDGQYSFTLNLETTKSLVSEDIKYAGKMALELLPGWLKLLEEKELLDLKKEALSTIDVTSEGTELRFVGISVNGEGGAYFERKNMHEWEFWGLS